MSTEKHFSRERDFHDDWAEGTSPGEIRVEATFCSPTAFENQHILKELGDLTDKQLLEIGCGLGEASVMFAKLGARVTASDLSEGMLRVTDALAAYHEIQLETCLSAGESIPLPSQKFDIIYTANTIHHLADQDAFLEEVLRLLKPGGIFCSWDPVKYNPVINVYRRMATEVRSEDEAPLGVSDLNKIKSYFGKTETRHFWLGSLILFLKYYLIDRVNPNQERYWKRIYQEDSKSLWWWKPFAILDGVLLRLPLLKWLSWNMVVIARK